MHSLDKEEFFKLNGYIKIYATKPVKPWDDGGEKQKIPCFQFQEAYIFKYPLH